MRSKLDFSDLVRQDINKWARTIDRLIEEYPGLEEGLTAGKEGVWISLGYDPPGTISDAAQFVDSVLRPDEQDTRSLEMDAWSRFREVEAHGSPEDLEVAKKELKVAQANDEEAQRRWKSLPSVHVLMNSYQNNYELHTQVLGVYATEYAAKAGAAKWLRGKTQLDQEKVEKLLKVLETEGLSLAFGNACWELVGFGLSLQTKIVEA